MNDEWSGNSRLIDPKFIAHKNVISCGFLKCKKLHCIALNDWTLGSFILASLFDRQIRLCNVDRSPCYLWTWWWCNWCNWWSCQSAWWVWQMDLTSDQSRRNKQFESQSDLHKLTMFWLKNAWFWFLIWNSNMLLEINDMIWYAMWVYSYCIL